MEHKLIHTPEYLIIVDDSEIEEGDWVITTISEIGTYNIVERFRNNCDVIYCKKIIAHLPLNNSPILEGVDLLPQLEDDSNKYAYDYAVDYRCPATNEDEYCKHDIISAYNNGYNKAKETYKYTEDDIRKAIEVGVNAEAGDYPKGFNYKLGISLEDYFIQSLQQPKLPIAFECEMVDFEVDMGLGEECIEYSQYPKTTTNPQGQTVWMGKYIF